MRRIVTFLFVIFAISAAHADERFITLSSTTSTQDSGLFGYILPIFKVATGIDVHVVAVGTGQALAIGQRGDADALLVHDRPGEDKFVAEGYGIDRRDVMYNDFVIVGPHADPAGIRGLKDAKAALMKSPPPRCLSPAGATIAAPTGWSYGCGRLPVSSPTRTTDGIGIWAKGWARRSTSPLR